MKTAASISSRIVQELNAMSVKIESVSQLGHQVDGEIKLGGAHDGIHFQVGNGYYNVVAETPDGCFQFISGRGKIADELKQALAA